eukprot:257387_1
MEATALRFLFTFVCLVCIGIKSTTCCENYWQSNNNGPSSSRRPFDVCYRSYRYRDASRGDWSYNYICNQSVVNGNLTVGGYSVFKQFYHGVGCEGEPNATILEDTPPFSIYCGGSECPVVRYRVYDIENKTECSDEAGYPQNILDTNTYEERVHVIERCDDDGFVSDSYFCSKDYFYINSYNNDQCDNDGIYAAEYYFGGCNDNDEFIDVIACGKDSGFSSDDKGLKTMGIIFIVLAIVAVLCACSFVIYHCAKTSGSYSLSTN